MANRTVSVALELQAQQYKGEADQVIGKTREMDHEVEALDRDIKDLGPDAAKAAAGIALLGQEHSKLGNEVDRAKAKVDGIGEAIRKTDEEIAKSKTLMSELAAEFAKTGDLDIVKKFTGERSNLSRLTGMRKDLEDIKVEAEKASREAEKLLAGAGNTGQGLLDFALDEWIGKVAKSTGKGLQQGLDSISGFAPTGFIQWLIAGGVAAAPAILAAIDGALLAGVGTVGIGSALALQARDPQVAAAYKQLGGDILQDLTDATSGFKQPMLALAQDFRNDWASVLPELKSGWDALVPSVEHFGQGIAGLATHTIPGFVDAEKASAGIINMLGDELPRLGDAFSSFFSSIAAGSEGGKKALQDTLLVVEGMIVMLGKLIEYGSKAFDWLDKLKLLGPVGVLLDKLSGQTDRTKTSFQMLHGETDQAATSMDDFAAATGPAITAQEKLNATLLTSAGRGGELKKDLDALYGSQVAAADASEKFDGAMVTLRDTVASHTQTTTLSKAAVDSHKAAINQATVTIQSNEAAIKAHKGSLAQHQAAIQSAQAAIESHQQALKGQTNALAAGATSLATNTKEGLANRQMLEQVTKASVDMMIADVNNGMTLEQATKKHEERIEALRREAVALGFTKKDTDELIATYGEVPRNVITNLTLTGAEAVKKQLIDLKIAQLSLSQNIDISAATREIRNQAGQGFGGLASGGRIPGPPSSTDNIVAQSPWGALGLATGEFVVNASATQKALPLLEWINSGMPGYAAGGMLGGPWPTMWPFPVDAAHTKIPTTLDALKAQFSLGALGGTAATGALGAWIAQAMALAGVPASWAAPLHTLIMRESGGNPRSINLYDINAQHGDPSRGLMQTIGATFNAYRLPSLSADIYDPVSNIVAGIRYILARYGDISHVQQANANLPPMGYARGGLIPAIAMDSGYGVLETGANLVINGTGGREAIYGAPGRVVSGGGGGRSEVTHRVVIQEPTGRRIAELVIEDSRNGGTAFNAYVRQVASR